MCLTIPKKVVSIKRDCVEVCAAGSGKIQTVGTIVRVKKGDWVLTQNKIIVSKITRKQAEEINNFLNKNNE